MENKTACMDVTNQLYITFFTSSKMLFSGIYSNNSIKDDSWNHNPQINEKKLINTSLKKIDN